MLEPPVRPVSDSSILDTRNAFVKKNSTEKIALSTAEIDRNDLLDLIRILIEYILARNTNKNKFKIKYLHDFIQAETRCYSHNKYTQDPAWDPELYGFT